MTNIEFLAETSAKAAQLFRPERGEGGRRPRHSGRAPQAACEATEAQPMNQVPQPTVTGTYDALIPSSKTPP